MNTPEHRAKVFKPETYAKVSKAMMGKNKGRPPANKGQPRSDETRARISAALQGKDCVGAANRGGNGRGLTPAQQELWNILGSEWVPEYPIKLGGKQPGYPTNYKPDLAHPARMIAIEVDGLSHLAHAIRAKDIKKQTKLEELGWTVFRFKNEECLSPSIISKLKDARIISQTDTSSITAGEPRAPLVETSAS